MGTNCAPLLANIFLYSYEAEFIQSLLSTRRKKLAYRFDFTYRCIHYVLSINNQEYSVELEIKDTAESNTSASYLDLLLSVGRDGQFHTSINDKRDDFYFHIPNFPNAIRRHLAASRRKMPNTSPSHWTISFSTRSMLSLRVLCSFFFCISFCMNRVTISY